jgi:lipopolysaccharide transport system ATP-binding protein
MQVRLGFAVAAHLEPEVLIVDEVLAVGDAAFQRKCIAKLGDVSSDGRTVLVVSHNMAIIEGLCSRAILLDRGHLLADDATPVVIQRYAGAVDSTTSGESSLVNHEHRLAGMNRYLKHARLLSLTDRVGDTFAQGEPLVVEIDYDATACNVPLSGVGLIISSLSGSRVGGFNTYMGMAPPYVIPQAGRARFVFQALDLTPGSFWVTISLGTDPGTLVDKVEHALGFMVEPRDIYGTGYLLSPDDGVVSMSCDVTYAAEL